MECSCDYSKSLEKLFTEVRRLLIEKKWFEMICCSYQEVESEIYSSEYENEDDDESNYEDDHIIWWSFL